MFKAITKYLHKIFFGNTGAQLRDGWPYKFNLKIHFLLVNCSLGYSAKYVKSNHNVFA